jgi:pimeloyl-ACP methyl ester carboxylesterase
MATDALMLLDHLNIESAHVVGVSMGGMIAQTLATMAPNRVRSLSSVMSTTGRLHPVLAPSLLFLMKLFLFRAAPAAADTNIENHVKFMISGNMLTGTGGAAETFNGGNSRYNHFLVTARRQLDRTGIARQVEAIETVRVW